MKRFFQICIFFFAFALTFFFGPNELQVHEFDNVGYIQSVKKESVVLVSNNFFNGEINTNQQKKNQDFSNSIPIVLTYNSGDSLFNKGIALTKGCFIHNLSTNKTKVHQIRAP